MTGKQIIFARPERDSVKEHCKPPVSDMSFIGMSMQHRRQNPLPQALQRADSRQGTDGCYKPLELTKTYRVATNDFLAPAGGDGFTAFQGMTSISYGDMLGSCQQLDCQGILGSIPIPTLDGRIAWGRVDVTLPVGRRIIPSTV